MTCLGKESHFLIGYLAQAASNLCLCLIYIIIIGSKNNEQQHDEIGKPTDDFLAAIHLHIVVDIGINGVETVGLTGNLIVLHLYNVGILVGNKT